jgi:potassium efflux system protein
MTKVSVHVLIAAVVCVLSYAGTPLPLEAQSQASADRAAPSDKSLIAVPTIQQRLKEIDESTDLDESLKTTLRDLYQQALKELESAAKAALRAADFSLTARTAPEDIGRVRRDLAKLPEEPAIGSLDRSSLDQLQEMLTQREADVVQLREELDRLNDEPKRRATRRRDIPKFRTTTTRKLEEVQSALQAEPDESESPDVALARRRAKIVGFPVGTGRLYRHG